jgi:hypothetical protein
MYRITGHYPMVVSVGRGPIPVWQGQRMGEQGAVGQPPHRTVRSSLPLAITGWVPSRITSTAIALSVAVLLLGMAPRVAASSSR